MSGAEGAAVAGAGTAIGIWQNIEAANKQAEAARKDAELKNLQAIELLDRQTINEEIMRDRAEESGSQHAAAFAATGREGAGIGGVLKIQRDTEEAIRLSRRDAEFKAKMLRAGANIQTDLSSDAVTAAYITGAGTALTSGAQIYSTYKPKSQTKSLSKAPEIA